MIDAMKGDLCSRKMTDKVFDVIVNNVNGKIEESLSLDTPFSILELNSLAFMKLIVVLEDEFDIEFDDEMLFETSFTTIRTMVDYVKLKVMASL